VPVLAKLRKRRSRQAARHSDKTNTARAKLARELARTPFFAVPAARYTRWQQRDAAPRIAEIWLYSAI
jgi:hypothetical protein